MKKRNLKLLKLNKKLVSDLQSKLMTGGHDDTCGSDWCTGTCVEWGCPGKEPL